MAISDLKQTLQEMVSYRFHSHHPVLLSSFPNIPFSIPFPILQSSILQSSILHSSIHQCSQSPISHSPILHPSPLHSPMQDPTSLEAPDFASRLEEYRREVRMIRQQRKNEEAIDYTLLKNTLRTWQEIKALRETQGYSSTTLWLTVRR